MASSLHQQQDQQIPYDQGNKVERSSLKAMADRLLRRCLTVECFIVFVTSLTLVPPILVLFFAIPKSMADDGITTMQEIMKVLLEAQRDCNKHLANDLPPPDSNGNYHRVYCKGEWDHLSCWPNSAPGSTVDIPCPEYIPDFDHAGKAQRHCHQDGTWAKSANSNLTWTDYSGCLYPEEDELIEAIKLGDPKTRSLIQLYTVGYSFSLVALIIAVIILAYFKRLHCTRNYIHMHLFVSFILRAAVIFVKDRVLYIGAGILDIRTQGSDMSLDAIQNQLLEIPNEKQSYYIGCKVVMTMFHYFVATNYYWILVEALYLHSLIFVAFFSDRKYLWRFIFTGWGVPLIFVVPWVIARATLDDTACWDIAVSEYKWIYNGPIVVANVINFLLFLNIIRVLWYKMKERGSVGRSDNRKQYKKLAKSTLVLIPMFGVHAIVFIGMPDHITSGTWWDIRMYFDLFFNSFQGFFVAIIYCFCNGEVQAEFKKAWQRFNLSAEIQRDRRDRSRSSVTMVTSFNSFPTQARSSVSGQPGGRRSSERSSAASISCRGRSRSSLQSESACMKMVAENEETSLLDKLTKNPNNDKTNADEEVSMISPHPRVMHPQTSSITNQLILPIAEEPGLEETFKCAVEPHFDCPVESFNLVGEKASVALPNRPISDSSDESEMIDDFDDVISGDETKRLRHKKKQRARRAESEDSGFSSMSACYWKSRDGSASTSQSEYCADSEDIVSDDVRQSSDGDSCSGTTHLLNDEEILSDYDKAKMLKSMKESGV